jgi:hypothetical protein
MIDRAVMIEASTSGVDVQNLWIAVGRRSI